MELSSLTFSLAVVYGHACLQIWIHTKSHGKPCRLHRVCSTLSSDPHADSQHWMAQTQTVCCNNTETPVDWTSVIRAMTCPCQLMPLLSQKKIDVAGWRQRCHGTGAEMTSLLANSDPILRALHGGRLGDSLNLAFYKSSQMRFNVCGLMLFIWEANLISAVMR